MLIIVLFISLILESIRNCFVSVWLLCCVAFVALCCERVMLGVGSIDTRLRRFTLLKFDHNYFVFNDIDSI
jgi:hypothetical protein